MMPGVVPGVMRAWLGFAGVLVVGAAGLGAIAHLPVSRQGGDSGLWGLWLGCAVSLAAAAAGSVPLARLVERGDASDGVVAVGKATLIRFAVTLAGAGWLWAGKVVAMRPLLLWLVVSYLVLLAVETWWLLRALRSGASKSSQLGV